MRIFLNILYTTIFYVALILLILVFAIHGVQGMQIANTPVSIVQILGFPMDITYILVFLTGFLDIIVAVMLIIHPRKGVLLWAGTWPWIPFFITQYGGWQIVPLEAFSVSLVTIAVLLTQQKLTILEFLLATEKFRLSR